ncbi:lasso peptide biosynthesis PqqD family chaperone [Mesobacillus jeotgali]|uniref:lasso peptide biosynthesis PqqD family chaperone n=1 Tax=Mesobacillus jeotgali TaxID=129985 RepID=UPI001CFD1CCD|nr:lasso peptide biosynthesis PqqD family chaperone [Mesobacillus jeotgali]
MIKNQISLQDTVIQVKGNIVSDMSGEKVMLSIKNGKYYNLGTVGGEIWAMIQTPTLIKDLVYSLTDTFEVEHSECEEHVLKFLDHLLEEGLIELSNG